MEHSPLTFWSGGRRLSTFVIVVVIGISTFIFFSHVLQQPIKADLYALEIGVHGKQLINYNENVQEMWSKTPTKETEVATTKAIDPPPRNLTQNSLPSMEPRRRNHSGLTRSQELAIRLTREEVMSEVKDFLKDLNRNTSDVLPELGGTPVRCMLATSWRSGSTFLAESLTSHPGVFYHYEPLLDYLIRQIRGGPIGKRAVKVLKKLLHCNYKGLDSYLEYGMSHQFLFSHTVPLWKWRDMLGDDMFDLSFLSAFCSLFPVQIIKTVRLRSRLFEELLTDPSLQLRIILLVRDPRGTMESRKHRDWCPGNPDCDNPKLLCDDLYDDYKAAKYLSKAYPNRFRVLRYEDASLSVNETIPDLLEFCGLQNTESVQEFLSSHTTFSAGGVSSTYRDSKKAPFMWRERLKWEEVNVVQKKCGAAMKAWGYRKASKHNVLSLLPIHNYSIS